MDYSRPGSSVHEILQARILEWVAISFFRGSSFPRDGTPISSFSRWILYCWATREALLVFRKYLIKNNYVPIMECHSVTKRYKLLIQAATLLPGRRSPPSPPMVEGQAAGYWGVSLHPLDLAVSSRCGGSLDLPAAVLHFLCLCFDILVTMATLHSQWWSLKSWF